METKNLNYEEKVKILNQIFKENQMGTIDRTTVVDGGDECVLLLEDSISLLYDFVFDAGRRKKGFDKNKLQIDGLMNIIHTLCKKGASSKYSNLNRNYKAILTKKPVEDKTNPYRFTDTCFEWIENMKMGLNKLMIDALGENQRVMIQQGLDACDEMEAILPRIWDNCSKDAYKYAKEFIELCASSVKTLQNKDFTVIDQFVKAKESLLKWENCRKEVGKLFSSVDVSKETNLKSVEDDGFKVKDNTKLGLIKEAIDGWDTKVKNRQLPCYASYDMTQSQLDTIRGEIAIMKTDLKRYVTKYKNGDKSTLTVNSIKNLKERIKKKEVKCVTLENQLMTQQQKIDISLDILNRYKFFYLTLTQSGVESDFFKVYINEFDIAQLNKLMNPFQITQEDTTNFRVIFGSFIKAIHQYDQMYNHFSDEYMTQLDEIENLDLGGEKITIDDINKTEELSEEELLDVEKLLGEDNSLDDEDISLDDEDEIEIRIKKDVVDDD